jgi:hypothetical protein
VPVVRLVESEGVLHDLGDVSELVAHDAVAFGDRVFDVDLLDLEGGIGVQYRHCLGRRRDGFALHPGRTEDARNALKRGGGHGMKFLSGVRGLPAPDVC